MSLADMMWAAADGAGRASTTAAESAGYGYNTGVSEAAASLQVTLQAERDRLQAMQQMSTAWRNEGGHQRLEDELSAAATAAAAEQMVARVYTDHLMLVKSRLADQWAVQDALVDCALARSTRFTTAAAVMAAARQREALLVEGIELAGVVEAKQERSGQLAARLVTIQQRNASLRRETQHMNAEPQEKGRHLRVKLAELQALQSDLSTQLRREKSRHSESEEAMARQLLERRAHYK